MTISSVRPSGDVCQETRAYQVKLIPALSVAAMKQGIDKELSIWLCLRSIDIPGSGYLRHQLAVDLLTSIFNYSDKTARRTIKQAQGTFLDIQPQKRGAVIKIYGVLPVCQYLNTQLTGDKHTRVIKPDNFSSLQQRRSQLYASMYKPDGITANPISRKTVTDLTGLHKVQQRRYEKTAGIKRTPNYLVKSVNGQNIPVKHTVTTRKQSYTLNKRLPNIYHTRQQTGNKGMLPRVAKSLNTVKAAKASFMVGKVSMVKCYFHSAKKALQALTAGIGVSMPYLLVRSNQRVIRGRLEWETVLLN